MILNHGQACGEDVSFPLRAKRILFLGDSITHAGGFVNCIEAQMRLQHVNPMPEIVNIGLSSETCSGLSEPDHPFPRPNVHERLARALEMVSPDVVVACYGMNDGIYYPLSTPRFDAYKAGVRSLIEKVHAAGAKLVLLTPPPFDAVPLRDSGKLRPDGQAKYSYFAMYEDYDSVLEEYARWIVEEPLNVEMVIDVHTPFLNALTQRRQQDPKYTMSPDGIHPNADGHQVLADSVLAAWGLKSKPRPSTELMSVMNHRGALLHDAWLSHVGHQRPGVKEGLPVDVARMQAADLL
ncbi:MAG: SGNH/GDSL hydrolase family protein, partial [Planctomycetaceae bacterium]|nr:SGNH/GDSL hydrolase family protein [Planctomycetaceae bacterium]